MVATVAADEPETAAKIAQPMTFVCSRRPGIRFNQGAKPLKRSCDSRVRKRISPIHKNSGKAVSVQLDAAPQILMAIASPAERAEKISMPSQAAPARVRPTHTPLARKPMMETTSMVITKISFMQCSFLGVAMRPAKQAAEGFIHHGDKEDDRACRHSKLGNPQWGGVFAGGNVVERVGIQCQLAAEPCKVGRNNGTD